MAEKIPAKNINGLYIQNPTKSILKYGHILRRKGVHIIVLTFPKGLDCTSLLAKEKEISELKVNFNPHNTEYCDLYKNELVDVLEQLPPHTIDVILTSGKKSKVANFIKGHPVLQNHGRGHYISWMKIYFDTKYNRIAPELTKIFQPVQLCHQFFNKEQDCFTGEKYNDRELIPASFLGEPIFVKNIPKFR